MASSDFQPLQGMSDIYAPDIFLWQQAEAQARDILKLYGYSEVRTPLLERTEVFSRSLGDTTDVVQKEMYSFEDRGGRHLTLRPEGTAGVVRFIAAGGAERLDARVYYMGPMFRAERPQAGRKRQFHQMGAECLGAPDPLVDAECIAMQRHLFSTWGLKDTRIQLNTRGAPEDRDTVRDGLREALVPHREQLCEDCQRRFDANVLRVLDCKKKSCGEIVEQLPPVTSFMQQESRAYFDEVQAILTRLEIPFAVNPRLVRGLDYYAHTVWEITHHALGAQDAMAAGGRYGIAMSGKTVEGVGFAVGMERTLQALQAEGVEPAEGDAVDVWIVSLGEDVLQENMILAMALRERGISCRVDGRRSMKAQMRGANRAGASFVIIRGEQEMKEGLMQVKDMQEGDQSAMTLPEVMASLQKKLT